MNTEELLEQADSKNLELIIEINKKEDEIERLNNIIKEVREYCINRSQYFNEARIEQYPFSIAEEYSIENILEILDKGE